ncbi:MAG: hypothetical protein ACE15B_10710 [Bryobacteraceae bacterium]
MRAACLLLACAAALAAPAPRTIKVPVWVDGNPKLTMKELKANSRILDVQGPQDGLIVLLVVDLAGDLAFIEPAKNALAAGINGLAPKTWVGVLRAQDGLRVLADPSPDRAASIAAVRETGISAKAGLLDTVETAENIGDSMLAKAGVRVAVLYVTDSDVQNYREDFTNPVINSSDPHDLSRRFPEGLVREKIAKLSARLARRQAPLFIVHLRYRSDRLNEAYQAGLKELAAVTGGSAQFCRSDAEIPEAVRKAFETIGSYYSVTLALPERAGADVQVQLEAEGGRNLTYRTRFVLKEKR